MKKLSLEKITNIGTYVREQWNLLAKKYSLKIKIIGIPALSSFIF